MLEKYTEEIVSEVNRMTTENEWTPSLVAKVIRRKFDVEIWADDVRNIVKENKKDK